MLQFNLFIKRLRKPSVIVSLSSQVISLLLLLGVNVNVNFATSLITILTSVLVTLGICSNPDTRKKGFSDDISICHRCGIPTQHVEVGGIMRCVTCGCSESSGLLPTNSVAGTDTTP